MEAERTVPSDGQHGDPLAPLRRGSLLPFPRKVCTIGVNPQSPLNKMILAEVFGFENLSNMTDFSGLSGISPDCAIAVGDADFAVPGLAEFQGLVGGRNAVIDIKTFVRMASKDGFGLDLAQIEVPARNPVTVFQHRMNAEVYPSAPAVEVEDSEALSCGFATGDRFHLYRRSGESLVLRVLAGNEKVAELVSALGGRCRIFASSAGRREPAILLLETARGGSIAVFDLGAADRLPEPSGSESLPVHILLSALGRTRVVFGKFLTAFKRYADFVEALGSIHRSFPEFTRMQAAGRSSGGLEMQVFSVALDFEAPPLLISSGIHPLEWAPAYGIMRYLTHLLGHCKAGSDYARILLSSRQIRWLVCACPDGWETRNLQPPGIDLNRNFPGSWERCVPGETYWDAYNLKYSTAGEEQLVSRGPAPASQPETRAMMALLGPRVTRLADFHETTAFESFFHPVELEDGTVPGIDLHLRLNRNMGSQFNGRFHSNGNTVAFRPGLTDFSTYRFREQSQLARIVPAPHCGWISYAAQKGIPSLVVEASGCDCTHYQTIRRTEYAATAAEQIIGNESGAFLRNPMSENRECTISLRGLKAPLEIMFCDHEGALSEKRRSSTAGEISEKLPPDWTVVVREV